MKGKGEEGEGGRRWREREEMRYIYKKLFLVLTGIILIVATTGIAVAEEMNVDPNSLELVPGGPAQKYDVTISNFTESGGIDHMIVAADAIWLLDNDNGDPSDLIFWFTHPSAGTPPGTPGEGFVSFDWVNDSDPDYLELWVKAKSGVLAGEEYDIIIGDLGFKTRVDVSAATVTASTIPEFTTLAIPMAIAILSGLFFLNHRKRREE